MMNRRLSVPGVAPAVAVGRVPRVRRVRRPATATPPALLEAAYYALLLYGMVGPGLGIVVPLLAGGGLLLLAVWCVLRSGVHATILSDALKWPFACALSFLAIQLVFHGGSLLGEIPRLFITWILGLVLIQALGQRPGFLHRCVMVLWAMGLTTLPYLIGKGPAVTDGAQRAAVDAAMAGDFNNPNGLGGWFGFCAIYFAVVTVEGRRAGMRVTSGIAAVACLYVVGLSVSRGALLGALLGTTIASRRLLRRGFVPAMLAIILAGATYYSGAFDSIVSQYSARGTEDTGRLLVWPAALERFAGSPLLGVGVENVATSVPGRLRPTHPHNSFLWFALSSGLVPLAFFVALWIRAGRNSTFHADGSSYAPFRLPLLVHTFITTIVGDLGFMQPWGLLTLYLALATVPVSARRLDVPHSRRPLHGACIPARPLATAPRF